MVDVDSMKVDGLNARFSLFNIFYSQSITKLIVHKNISIVGKPTVSAINLSWILLQQMNFHKALFIMGIISIGSNSISPIMCSIRKLIISCFASPVYIFMFRYFLLSLLLATMVFNKEHQKQRSVCYFHYICIAKTPDQND